jgi:serine/threonine-protein kinase
MATSADLPVGTDLLGYRIEAVLGRGGMGVVYLAEDRRLKRRVALKLLAAELAEDERFRQRLLEESELAASLDHPNIVPVYEAGEVDGQIFISMRYVEGEDLKQRLRRGPIDPAYAVALVSQVAGALDAAHARGLVHRDVKPSNVLIAPEAGHEGADHVYLADFGLTRRLAEPEAPLEPGQLMGTLDYVAPEQIRGDDVDGRADVYSLGCLLHECVTGRPPFVRASDAAVLYAHLEDEPPATPGLEHVMRKALAKTADERYQTCRALVDAARTSLGIAPPRTSRWPLAVAAVGVAVVVAALLAFFLTRGGGGAASALGGRLLRIDPSSNRVTASFPVAAGAGSVAVGDGRVWAGSYIDESLWQLDPETREVVRRPAFGRPSGLALYQGSAYVAADGPGPFGGNVGRFDAISGGRLGDLPLDQACSLSSGPYGLWLAGCPNVDQLTAAERSPRVAHKVPIPAARPLSAENYRESLTGIAQGAGAIWVTGDAADRRLWRIDPVRHRITATIPLAFPPASVAFGGGAAWVTDGLADRLVKIDPGSNRVVASVGVGRGASGVAYGRGSVWVADAIAHAVTRVDPRSVRVLATIPVAAGAQGVAVGENAVWVVGDAR